MFNTLPQITINHVILLFGRAIYTNLQTIDLITWAVHTATPTPEDNALVLEASARIAFDLFALALIIDRQSLASGTFPLHY